MNWVILIIAGFCETGFAFCLGKAKPAVGSEWWWWIAGFAFFYVLSAVLLAKATQTIPIGIAYPVWTGIGAVGAVLLGIFVFTIYKRLKIDVDSDAMEKIMDLFDTYTYSMNTSMMSALEIIEQ